METKRRNAHREVIRHRKVIGNKGRTIPTK